MSSTKRARTSLQSHTKAEEAAVDTVDVQLKMMDGSTIDVKLPSQATVLDVKMELQSQEGKPTSSQIYYLKDVATPLPNGSTLANLLAHSESQSLEITVQFDSWSFDHFNKTPFNDFNTEPLKEGSTSWTGGDCDFTWLSGPKFPKDGMHSFSICIDEMDGGEEGTICIGVGDMSQMSSDSVLDGDMWEHDREMFYERQVLPPACWFICFDFNRHGCTEIAEFNSGSLTGFTKPQKLDFKAMQARLEVFSEADFDEGSWKEDNYSQPTDSPARPNTGTPSENGMFEFTCGSTITVSMDRDSKSVSFSMDGKCMGSLQNIYPSNLSPVAMCTWSKISLALD
jgi:hypothetical protein